MLALAALILVVPAPRYAFQHASVDRVELNHVYRAGEEKPSFRQVICWRWVPFQKRYVVSEWFSAKGVDVKAYGWNGRKRVMWRGRRGVVFEACTPTYRETHTRVDPEVLDRDVCSIHNRVPYFEKVGP